MNLASMHGFAKILLAIFLNTESVVDTVSECCYSGEWLVFRKYPIEYSMVLTNSSSRWAIQLERFSSVPMPPSPYTLPLLPCTFQS